jgi:thioredoxin 1
MLTVINNNLQLSDDNINILYFSAVWCQPCKVLKPIMEEISDEFIDNVDVHFIDINDNLDLMNKYKVMSIPTLVFIENNDIKKTIVGVKTKITLIDEINNIK